MKTELSVVCANLGHLSRRLRRSSCALALFPRQMSQMPRIAGSIGTGGPSASEGDEQLATILSLAGSGFQTPAKGPQDFRRRFLGDDFGGCSIMGLVAVNLRPEEQDRGTSRYSRWPRILFVVALGRESGSRGGCTGAITIGYLLIQEGGRTGSPMTASCTRIPLAGRRIQCFNDHCRRRGWLHGRRHGMEEQTKALLLPEAHTAFSSPSSAGPLVYRADLIALL